MYETGFSVAAIRNQSTPMRLRGAFIDEMNRNEENREERLDRLAGPGAIPSHAPSAPNERATSAP